MTNKDIARHPRLEALLARLLDQGTWVACLVIGAGIVAILSGTAGPAGSRIVQAGVAVFIALPILRVLTMVIVFVKERDFVFGAIATFVLMVIVLGAVISMEHSGGTF